MQSGVSGPLWVHELSDFEPIRANREVFVLETGSDRGEFVLGDLEPRGFIEWQRWLTENRRHDQRLEHHRQGEVARRGAPRRDLP